MRLVRVRSKWHTKKVFNKETTPSPAHGNKPNKQCGRGHYAPECPQTPWSGPLANHGGRRV